MEPTTDIPARTSLDKDPGPSPAPQAPSAAHPLLPPGWDPLAEPEGAAAEPVPPRFRLQRSRTDRMLGGVCGGLASSLGVDVTLLRIGLVALTVLGAGIGVVFYVAAWILAPEADVA